jgi:two-component system, NarL family, response regulator NreC
MKNKLKILITEDHQTVREGLKLIIDAQDDMETVGEAGDGREAVRLAREIVPDVVLMDISMPTLNGLKATAQLKRIAPDIKILILTRHTDTAYLREVLQAGADGYILKQSAVGELLRAVQKVAAGEKYLDPAITKTFVADYTDRNQLKSLRGDVIGANLTIRESETLRHIALGYSNKEIAEKFDISVKTVEAHKANAQQKLDIHSRKEIIGFAILQGWMQEN